MSEPASLALQAAQFTVLSADPAVVALVGARIYDRVPPSAATPYVTIGDGHALGGPSQYAHADTELWTDIHVWSRAGGKVEAKRILGAVRAALADVAIPVAGWAVIVAEFEQERILDDPDGVTVHGVATLHYYLQPTA